MEQKMDSFELAARYSFMPNKLKYCGPEDTDQILFDYVKGKADKRAVKQILEQFNALYLYLNLIAKHNNKDVFDNEVVEAYWLGNKLLDNVPPEYIKNLIYQSRNAKVSCCRISKQSSKKCSSTSFIPCFAYTFYDK
jgi:hypothetical protein